ncbi:hypothetical protein JCM10450v2_005399 [Rhodotorula kratochvilovae]
MAPSSPRSPRSPSRRPNLSVVFEEHEYDAFSPLIMSPHNDTPASAARDHTTVPLLASDAVFDFEEGDSFDEKTGLPLPASRSARRQNVYSRARGEAAGAAPHHLFAQPARRVKALAMLALMALVSGVLYLGSGRMAISSGGDEGGEAALSGTGRWSATLLVLEPVNASLVERPVGYNPLFPKLPIEYDYNVSIESLRTSISTSEPSSIIFHCRHEDVALCASAYRVLLAGPTMHSPTNQRSKLLDERRVEVSFDAIRDPGWYEVYAWPEHETCDQFNHGDGPAYHKLAVSGTPVRMQIVGEQPLDYARECMPSDDLTDGRWVSKAFLDPAHHAPESPFHDWLESHLAARPQPPQLLTDYSTFGYVWAPYACKPRHRSFDEWIDTLKPERLVVFGDSVMRDLFCLMYKPQEEVCKYEMFGAYEQLDKYIAHTRSDGGISHLHFRWEPLGNAANLRQFLTALETPPSHLFFGVGLWLTREDPDAESYAARMKPLLDMLVEVVPKAKIVARTMAGAVQSVACFDLWRIQRRILEPANAALLRLLRNYPPIQPLNVYPIYNDRPEATQDGRHWQKLPGHELERPEEGSVGYAVTDIIFEGWRLQMEEEVVETLP